MKYRQVKCPSCKSGEVSKVDYRGIKCIVCELCGYDERVVFDVGPQFKVSQREKSRNSPYKSSRDLFH